MRCRWPPRAPAGSASGRPSRRRPPPSSGSSPRHPISGARCSPRSGLTSRPRRPAPAARTSGATATVHGPPGDGKTAPGDPEAAAVDGPPRPGRPPHPFARPPTAPPGSSRSSTTSSGRPARRHRDHRPRAGRRRARRAGPRPGARPAHEGRRRGGLDAQRPSPGPVHRGARPAGPFLAHRSPRSTSRWPRDPGSPARAVPALRPGWVLRRLINDPDPRVRPDAIEAFQPDDARQAVAWASRPVRRRTRPRDRRQRRRPRGRGDRGRLDDVPRPHGRRPARRDDRPHDASPRVLPPARPRSSPHVRAPASQVRPRRPRHGRRQDPPRRHGPRLGIQTVATGRPASTRRSRRSGCRSGASRDEDRLVSPYVYPLPGERHPARQLSVPRTSDCAGMTSGILTSSHGLQRSSEGDVIRIGKGFSVPNGSVGTITLSPRYVSGPGHARARAVRCAPS